MNYIFAILTTVFGYLLNIFYVLLDLIGTPYVWLCIVLFSIVTRLMFLRGKIRGARKKKLAPVIDAEIRDIKDKYLLMDDDEREKCKKQINREIKSVHKKYRVSAGSGCLSALLQLPIFIALYNVVISPELYVPEIKKLHMDPEGNAELISTIQNFFGWDIGLSPLAIGVLAYVFPLLVCFLTICGNRKALSEQKLAGPKKNFFKWYTRVLLGLQVVILTCFSFKLPLGISIYWLSNDVANIGIDYFVEKSLNKSKKIRVILDAFAAEQARAAAKKAEEQKEAEENPGSDSEAAQAENGEIAAPVVSGSPEERSGDDSADIQ